jgi:long-chain fatty acid transport protein
MIVRIRARSAAPLIGICFAFGSAETNAAGFSIPVQTASSMGNANAAVAATAEDAGTAWWNPAGMSLLPKAQGVLALHVDDPSVRFENHGSQPALGQSLGGDGGDAGRVAAIPATYATMPIGRGWALGLAINSPFGLKTQYDDGWMGRFQTVKSQVRTYNVSPAVSTKLGDWSIGGGIDVQRLDAELTNSVNYTGAVIQGGLAAGLLTPTQVAALLNPSNPANVLGLQGGARISGHDTAVGWNLGTIFSSGAWRIGAHYRSRLHYHVLGGVSFDAPGTTNPLAAQIIAAASRPGGALANGDVSVDVTLPEMASLGVRYRLDNDVELLAGASWTAWSSVQQIRFVRSSGSLLNSIAYNWRNSWRLSGGANYPCAERWLLRGGVAWDQGVVRDDTLREPRLPDSDRYWGSLGTRYKPGRFFWFDGAFTYIGTKDARLINQNAGNTAAFGLLNGTYTKRSLVFSLQGTVEL